MTAAVNSDWSRDHVADANPDLTRKRQRLSEELEPSPNPSHDSVVVEALPPDEGDVVHDISSAIELQDDDNMDLFSSTLHLDPTSRTITAINQINFLINSINAVESTLSPIYFDRLATWLETHLAQTPPDSSRLRERYLDDADFFSQLGVLCFSIFQHQGDLFPEADAKSHGFDALGEALRRFTKATVALAHRLLPCLPGIFDAAVSRRDSAQTAKSRQHVPMLCWVQVLAQNVAMYGAFSLRSHCHHRLGFNPIMAAEVWRREFRPSTLTALSQLLHGLSQHHREIDNSWPVMDAILRTVLPLDLPVSKDVDHILATCHLTLLPLVCGKHSRALPEGFHQMLVEVSQKLLAIMIQPADMEGIASLYRQYVKSDHDGLLPEHCRDDGLLALVEDMSEDNEETLKALIVTSWALQAYRSYIFSEIMDVRSNGLTLLSARLRQIFHGYKVADGGIDHPMPQYASRFLRTNEVTKYIFGPDSHASLVKHSQDVIGFLAVTNAYTEFETDIIWNSCTNSVEGEFAKAAFLVLTDVTKYLGLDSLLYLAKKYTTTEPIKLGQDAVESLTELFQKVQLKADSESDSSQRLATAFISIDIMMRVDATSRTPMSAQLKQTAKLELYRFTQSPQSEAQDRVEIFRRCVPHIRESTRHATTCIEIMVMFLHDDKSGEEVQELLSLLSIDAAVNEMVCYVSGHRIPSTVQFQEYDVVAMDVRLELLLRLLECAGAMPDDGLAKLIFNHTVGDLAICNNDARDRAWRAFSRATPVARQLLLHWLRVEVMDLSPQYTTQALLDFLCQKFERMLQRERADEEFSQILDLTDWMKLVQVAESPWHVSATARGLICHILFVLAENHVSKPWILACHTKFAERQIRRACERATSVSLHNNEGVADVVGKIVLLQSVLNSSKQHAALYDSTEDADVRLDGEAQDSTLQYTLEIQGVGRHHPRIVTVRANAETKVSELVSRLPEITGAPCHRMIVAGHEIAFESRADSLLSDLGVQSAGVIAISPKHNISSDVCKVLTCTGAIEQQILEHHDELEELLDAARPIAAKVFELIVSVPVSRQVRTKLSSEQASASDLFPPGSRWRTTFYLNSIERHLRDLARLGVADEAFVVRGIAMLVHTLGHHPLPEQAGVCVQIMHVLTAFLRERPPTPTVETLIAEPVQFASCIIRICEYALSTPEQLVRLRHELIKGAFELLQEVCRRQPLAWQQFTADTNVTDLHAKILFHADVELSSCAAALVKNFSIDQSTPDAAIEFYTKVVLEILPQALSHGDRAKQFFDLATQLLFNNSKLWTDETSAREITQSVLATMWNYEHIESEDLPILDVVMAGLLGLIKESVSILRSFKKPLELPGLAANLFSQLLFADEAEHNTDGSSQASNPGSAEFTSRQLFHPQSRHEAYELIRTVCVTKEDFQELLKAMDHPLQAARNNPADRFPGRKEYLRSPAQCSGLTNLGQTCYMNSLLQQLFANVKFRQFIFDTPTDNERPDQQILLQELKSLFSWMQNSSDPVTSTSGLAVALGTEVGSQEDVHGFYEDFLSKLELEMPNQAAKNTLAEFYTGKLITQIKGECNHVSPRIESFVDLPIVVKNKRTLAETLDELVQGEPMQGANQYRCQSCDTDGDGRLVNAVRRSCPDVIPDNLTFCLKRFEFDPINGIETKVNDRFEFPQAINMSKYHHAHLDNPEASIDEDVFELVGVIVHMGTNGAGHYWSYTLLRNTGSPSSRTWIKLEDRNVTTCQDGLAQVQHECFGGLKFTNGNERTDNAYVLFYQRKRVLEQQIALPGITLDPVSQAVLPPRVAFDNDLEDEIRKHNAVCHRNAHLFDGDLAALMDWILAQSKLSGFVAQPDTSASPETSSDAGSEIDKAEDGEQQRMDETREATPVDDYTKSLSHVATTFLQRIATCDPTPVEKLTMCFNGLIAMFPDHPKLIDCVLRDLVKTNWFWGILGSGKKTARATIQGFLLRALSTVREHDRACHDFVVSQLRNLHANYIHRPESVAALDWVDYLAFAAKLAAMGPSDTAAILDCGHWSWAFEMIRLPFDKATRAKYPGLFDQLSALPEKMAAVYQFLLDLVENYLEISDISMLSPDTEPHIVQDNRALLKDRELALLGETSTGSRVFAWLRAARFAEVTNSASWRDFVPGKLLGALVGPDACPQLYCAIRDNLIQHIDAEEEQLSALLSLVMHFCTSTESQDDARLVFAAAARVTPSWEGSEGELIQILPSAMEEFPYVVLMTLELWVKHLLLIKASGVREPTANFVIQYVFEIDPDLTEPELVTTHARLAAKLVQDGALEMQHAFEQGRSRTRFESMIHVYKYIQPYLRSFRSQVSDAVRAGDEASLPLELRIEWDRAQQTLSALEDLGSLVAQWGLESAESGLPSGVIRSREEDSDEYESDEEVDDGWDSSSDQA
ncbi:hypothetical protein CERZMDRAFT_94833 [Cercospora zeae-maydis SCOH1-5]|uniref:USP domain-containing protein n=1 Tax=Cercospora zeae-maydis SCOH1-5 TaxID=717836 RepID=A0A6A6FPR5_9PEZI|nr:hypothetical protein CERZMDRAFT_94833 [Cercospora zeae-maydis SCOH1-5]